MCLSVCQSHGSQKINFLNNLYTEDATKYCVIPRAIQTFVTNVSGRYRYSVCVHQEPLHYLSIFFVLMRGARKAYSYLVMRRSHSSCLGARGYFRRSFPCGKVQAAEVRYHS
jgi:hypothetical protein